MPMKFVRQPAKVDGRFAHVLIESNEVWQLLEQGRRTSGRKGRGTWKWHLNERKLSVLQVVRNLLKLHSRWQIVVAALYFFYAGYVRHLPAVGCNSAVCCALWRDIRYLSFAVLFVAFNLISALLCALCAPLLWNPGNPLFNQQQHRRPCHNQSSTLSA